MSAASPLRTALRLGRVSNLPTVWTNVVAGIALSGHPPTLGLVVPVACSMSLSYVAGMFLNDAFDRGWDRVNRPERPIPAGEASASVVFAAGFGMLAASVVLLLALPGGMRAAASATALAALVVIYDVSHKNNPVAPVVMALCRVAVYVTASLAAAPGTTPALYAGCAAMLAYLVVLSSIARRETRDPRLPRLVGNLIAGISLLDAVVVLIMGRPLVALVCVGGFFLTRRMQRRIAGT
jgi:4-hydroxybenzoate polyprenyltransferase